MRLIFLREGGMKVHYAGPLQRFSPKVIMQGVRGRWLSINDDYITLHGVDGDVKYKITKSPGEHMVDGKRVVTHYFEGVKENG